jgi:hypothetical protein
MRETWVAVLLLTGCSVVPVAPQPTSEPVVEDLRCIYMISNLVEHPGEFVEHSFDFMVWAVRGKNVDGLTGTIFSESVQQWLTIDGSRAAGTQEVFPDGTEFVIYPIVGEPPDVTAIGWTRVDVADIQQYSSGYLGDGAVGGC